MIYATRVCFGEITPNCYRQIRGLRISPQKPGYFSKADTENPKFRGDLRPTAVAAECWMNDSEVPQAGPRKMEVCGGLRHIPEV